MITNEAFCRLQEMIGVGRFKPEERLPSESELTKILHVSRSSLREALKMLSALGIINSRRGSGWSVSPLRPENIMAGLELSVSLLPLSSFRELLVMRRILESAAASKAAACATSEEIDYLYQIAKKLSDSQSNEKSVSLDSEFHEFLVSLGRNAAISAFLKVLRNRSEHYHCFDTKGGEDFKRSSDTDHLEIVLAIRKRDPDMAESLMRLHILKTEQSFKELEPTTTFGYNSMLKTEA